MSKLCFLCYSASGTFVVWFLLVCLVLFSFLLFHRQRGALLTSGFALERFIMLWASRPIIYSAFRRIRPRKLANGSETHCTGQRRCEMHKVSELPAAPCCSTSPQFPPTANLTALTTSCKCDATPLQSRAREDRPYQATAVAYPVPKKVKSLLGAKLQNTCGRTFLLGCTCRCRGP